MTGCKITMRRCGARWRTDERGTQLVELALVMPLLLMLLGATAEFGRFMYTYTTLAKATRAGARYASSQPPGTAAVATRNLVVYGNTAGTGAPVVVGLTTANVGFTQNTGAATVSVQITGYTFDPVFDLGKLINRTQLSLRVPVSPSSTMRQLVQ